MIMFPLWTKGGNARIPKVWTETLGNSTHPEEIAYDQRLKLSDQIIRVHQPSHWCACETQPRFPWNKEISPTFHHHLGCERSCEVAS